MKITKKVALITGGASGIGAAIARRFAAEGAAHVAIADIDGPLAQVTADQVGGSSHQLDVTDESATSLMVADIESRHGPIDIACLNAGVAIGGSFDAPNDDWKRAWETNLMAHVYAARHIVPGMLERGSGYVITTASAAGLLTNIDAAPYAVTKHAAVSFAEWLAVTYGRRGLRVSCLCPQFVDTPMIDIFASGTDQMQEWVHDVAISPEAVAEEVVAAMEEERFLILPHPEVAEYFQNKAHDYDRWIIGMQGLQSALIPGT